MEVQTAQKKSKAVMNPGRRSHGRLYEGQHANVKSILHANRIQPKLRVGQPNDEYEQEADRVHSGTIQRACTACSGEYKTAENENRLVKPTNLCLSCQTQEQGLIQTKQFTPLVQRQEGLLKEEDESLIQAKTNGNITPAVTFAIGAGIQSLQGSGQPLSESDRGFFEPRIGADFSNVRIHRDSRAASVARSINARAFTHGHDVVFGTGEYSPNTRSGKKLLAHELTHTVQQGRRTPYVQRAVNTQPFTVVPDIDPAPHLFGGNEFLGITIPNLNGSDNILQPATFIRKLRLPTLAERDLRKIPRPDLSSSILNSIRTGKSLVRFGRNGTQVKLLQEALVAWGQSLSPPVNLLSVFGADGIFRSETKGAVETFQSAPDHLLTKDGLVGNQTLQALETAMAFLNVSEFTVDTVPTNDFTGRLRTPMAPAAWTAVTTTRVDLISQLSLASTPFGSCPPGTAIVFRIVPSPGVVPDTLKHEQVHEADITNTVQTELGPWDSGLELLRLIQIPFRGVDAPSVSAAVFASFPGATPCDIATIIPADWSQKNFNFHTSPSGFGTDLANMVLGPNCRTVTFTAMNATTSGTVHPPRTGAPCNAIAPALAVTRQIPVI